MLPLIIFFPGGHQTLRASSDKHVLNLLPQNFYRHARNKMYVNTSNCNFWIGINVSGHLHVRHMQIWLASKGISNSRYW